MKKIFTLLLISLLLAGCIFRTHKNDVEQGNIITQVDVNQLRLGMTENQVQDVMGNPILVNIFTHNRIEYIYTFQAGYGNMIRNRVSCIFYGGRLRAIQKD